MPAVVTVHDLTMLEHPEWHERSKVLVFGRALRLAARRAEVVVVPSEDARAAYRRHFGDGRPVLAIPHGVDRDRFAPDEPRPGADVAVLARYGLVEPYVLHVGTEEPRKNLPGLVRAFGALGARHPDLRLVLAGGRGWGSAALEQAIGASGLGARVVRLGYVAGADVPALLRRAAVVAYPAFAEGFGLPALEALSCGALLVTSAKSAMAEVSEGAAYLVDPASAEAITVGLEAALAGDGGEERRARGIALAAGYTWQRSAAEHLDAYRLAAEAGRRPSAHRA